MSSKSSIETTFEVKNTLKQFLTRDTIQVTNDGQLIYCQCSDNISIVEVSSGRIVNTLPIEEDEVTTCSLSPDNKQLAVGLKSALICHYSCQGSGTEVTLTRSFKSPHRNPLSAMCWDPSSTYIGSASSDGSVRVFHMELHFCTHSIKSNSGVVKKIKFHTQFEDNPILFGACGTDIYIWKLQDGSHSTVAVLGDHHSTVTDLQLTKDTTKLVSCSLDKTLILWDLETYKAVKILPVFESISSMVLKTSDFELVGVEDPEENGVYALIYGDKGLATVWDVQKGRLLWTQNKKFITLPNQEGVTVIPQMLLVPELKSVAVVTFEHSIILAHTKSMKSWKQLAGNNEDILDMIFCGQDDSHVVVASNSGQLKIYSTEDMNCTLVNAHSAPIFALARHPTRENIFGSCSSDNTAHVWKLTKKGAKCIRTASGHAHSVVTLGFGPDFMLTGSKDSCIKKWTLNLDDESAEEVLVSKYTVKAHDSTVNTLSVARNFKIIVTGSEDRTAKVWDAQKLEFMGSLTGHRKSIWHAQFSPVDQLVATASADGTIKIWSIADFSIQISLDGHNKAVLRLLWLPSGHQIVSSAADGVVNVWELAKGTCVNTFNEHDNKLWGLCLSRDGSTLVSGGEDSVINWWKDVTEERAQEKQQEVEKLVQKKQSLSNFLHKKKWKKALGLAIELHQPRKAFHVIRNMLNEGIDLSNVLHKLSPDQHGTLLEFVKDWNAKKYKKADEPNAIITFFVNEMLPEELQEIPGWKDAVVALYPYTIRNHHRQRRPCTDMACYKVIFSKNIYSQSQDDSSSQPSSEEYFENTFGPTSTVTTTPTEQVLPNPTIEDDTQLEDIYRMEELEASSSDEDFEKNSSKPEDDDSGVGINL